MSERRTTATRSCTEVGIRCPLRVNNFSSERKGKFSDYRVQRFIHHSKFTISLEIIGESQQLLTSDKHHLLPHTKHTHSPLRVAEAQSLVDVVTFSPVLVTVGVWRVEDPPRASLCGGTGWGGLVDLGVPSEAGGGWRGSVCSTDINGSGR